MNHHNADVATRAAMANSPIWSAPSRSSPTPPSSAMVASTATRHTKPRPYTVAPPWRGRRHAWKWTALQRRRERAGKEDRQHEPEHAGRLP